MDSGKQSEGFRGRWVGGWSKQVIGIREGMCCDEHWVLYATNEPLNKTLKWKQNFQTISMRPALP